MTSISDLLKRSPSHVSDLLRHYLCTGAGDDVPLPELNEFGLWPFNEGTCEGVDIFIAGYHETDHCRFHQLAVVRLHGAPVMALQNAGRSGSDHFARFIVSHERVQALVAHLKAKLTRRWPEEYDDARETEYGEDQDVPWLTRFYGREV